MTPATLSLNLTRGITFGPIIFLFSSKVIGEVTVNPPSNIWTCPGHGLSAGDPIRFQNTGGVLPAGVSASTTYYVIGSGLNSDQFRVSDTVGGSTIIVSDTGTGTQKALSPADLTNWIPYAEVRTEPEGTLILDLLPVISDPTIGAVLIPAIQDEDTILLPAGTGGKLKCKWDLIFQVPTGERIGPYIAGSFLIKSIITEPAEPVGP